MKRLTWSIAALLLALAALLSSGTLAGPAAGAASAHGTRNPYDFERFVDRYEAANTAFVNGDPKPWLAITAEKDPVSIFGGFGGLGEAGVASPCTSATCSRQRPSVRAARTSTSSTWSRTSAAGSLYTVAIERSEVLYAGQTERRPQVLRVTMIFRREHGAWKIVHRHADTMIDLQLPGAG